MLQSVLLRRELRRTLVARTAAASAGYTVYHISQRKYSAPTCGFMRHEQGGQHVTLSQQPAVCKDAPEMSSGALAG